MKILIAPCIIYPKESPAYILTRNLTELFAAAGDTIAISADKANGFKHSSLYPYVPLKAPRFNFNADNRSYEEYMYSIGASSRKYLQEDTAALIEAVDHFKPDWILSIDRTAALIAARATKTRCAVFINSAMYRNSYFPAKCLRAVNEILSDMQFEQVFDLKTLLDRCDLRLLFSPETIQPFLYTTASFRFKAMSCEPSRSRLQPHISVSLHRLNDSPGSIYRLLNEAFKGAPYQVYAGFHNAHLLTEENMHYIDMSRKDMVSDAMAVIHDGNEYLFHECIARGIPQLIITSHEYPRLFFAQAVRRNGIGDYIFEEDLDVSSLYEGFRKITDDTVVQRCAAVQKDAEHLPDLHSIRYILENR